MQDRIAQNALSTFVGGFLFALVGIIGLSTGIYGSDGHIVLFILTLLVVVIIVVTFLRWVDVLSNFGRVPDAIDRTARAAADAVAGWIEEPCLGGRPLGDAPETSGPVMAGRMGYVRHIDMGVLQQLAEEADGEVVVLVIPGIFLDDVRAIAETTFELDDDGRRRLCSAFDVGDNPTFDQDPRYGISALAEIGIKALSPGINDPVTAVRVIDRLVRVLTDWGNAIEGGQPSYDRVYVSPPDPDEVFSEAFSELALYGARDVRIGIRLQEAFRSLSRVADKACAAAARSQADLALERAKSALTVEDDYERLRAMSKAWHLSTAD
jgi:uncharacterized membrane protein